MKKVTQRVVSLLSAGCAAFVGLFTHTSCDITRIGAMEYGTPFVEYEVKAKVQDPQGKPIEGLEVQLLERAYGQEGKLTPWSKTVRTDANGVAHISEEQIGFREEQIYVQVPDVDSVKNGLWATKIDSIAVSPSDLKKEHSRTHWYNGTVRKETTITMEPAPESDKKE